VINIALGGHEAAKPDDPMFTVPQMADVPHLAGRVSQQRLEDLQLFGFLVAVSSTGGNHPIAIEVPARDPPDRVLRWGGAAWGIELTELTLEDVRSELGPIRAAGRRLQAALRQSTEHEHLRGRPVTATVVKPEEFPRDIDAYIAAAVEILKVDKGAMSDVRLDLAQGMPTQLPNVGLYGDVGPFHLTTIGPPGPPGEIIVATNVASRIHRSEALAALDNRVKDKDVPGNDLLLTTCGLPDKFGYDCAVDTWIYELLAAALAEDATQFSYVPRHITAIALHRWPTDSGSR